MFSNNHLFGIISGSRGDTGGGGPLYGRLVPEEHLNSVTAATAAHHPHSHGKLTATFCQSDDNSY